jgi:hypothetical protein
MPSLKTRMIFISHAWAYSEQYETVTSWFDSAQNFVWKNCSVPSTDSLPDRTVKGLMDGMKRQISPSQGVIVLAGMYVAHSRWIEYEINEAVGMNKVIIGVRPWGQERIPKIVQDSAHIIVGWNQSSVIDAVREMI